MLSVEQPMEEDNMLLERFDDSMTAARAGYLTRHGISDTEEEEEERDRQWRIKVIKEFSASVEEITNSDKHLTMQALEEQDFIELKSIGK